MPNAPTPQPFRRTTFTLVVKGRDVRIVCNSRWPKLIGKHGITIQNRIYLAGPPESVTSHLLAHEFAHVLQWEKAGFWGFLKAYTWGLIRKGYGLAHPLERDAFSYGLQTYPDFEATAALIRAVP